MITLAIRLGLLVLVVGGLLGWLIRSLRGPCVLVLIITSWVVGALVWLMCFGTVVDIWGMTVAIISLLFFGIGCMPMAILATIIHGSWHQLLTILAGFVAIYGCRMVAGVWDSEPDSAESEPHLLN
jgi:hypothetical protein